MKNSVLACIFLFSAFVFGQGKSAVTPKIVVKVPQGETVVLKGVSIKFIEVLEDSRCPTGVDCIWPGNAKVKTQVTANGNTEEILLTFGEVRQGQEKNTVLYNAKNFAINGVKLTPYPTSETAGKINDYVLLICEEKNN
ncbi:MAG: hypothetical protein CL526_11545 [Aequorivita sp.]|nr:hypothetical protein [Aequorivita sp.]|tara:strand:+ start:20802 stop:21218 length:417 start_codon:yes stop_codon:yes gene_type:complete